MARVLVACEFSGIVRDAFVAKGHEAWSCDLLPSERPGNHFQKDVRLVLRFGWDLLIGHPPCTYLAASGARWWSQRLVEQESAAKFAFTLLMWSSISKVVIENPIGYLSKRIRKPDQIIQPWMFGHPESKATCLWLKGLPLLKPTKIIEPEVYGCSCGVRFDRSLGKYGCPNCSGQGKVRLVFTNQTPTGQNRLGPTSTRAMDRSRTYQGVADAMAEQWGAVI